MPKYSLAKGEGEEEAFDHSHCKNVIIIILKLNCVRI